MTPEVFQKIMLYVVLLFAITVHEWAHAWAANKCGDPTARQMGRMTLNPLPHMSILGTVVFPLIMIFAPLGGFALIGWGKPVPVNPNNYRNYVKDDAFVSMAGIATNLLTMVVALIIIRVLLLLNFQVNSNAISLFLFPLAYISFILAFFNLIPIPPLDGSHLLRTRLSYEARKTFDKIASFGFIIMLVLINTGVRKPVFAFLSSIFFALVHLIAGLK